MSTDTQPPAEHHDTYGEHQAIWIQTGCGQDDHPLWWSCSVCAERPSTNADTPRPERVNLTHREHKDLGRALMETDRTKESAHVRKAVERILAAREQALREEIAGEFEALHNRLVAPLTPTAAARIARGETR